MDFIHGSLKTDGSLFGKQVFARNVGLDFHHFVLARVALLHPQENLKILDFVVVGQQLVQFAFDKVQQGRVRVKVDRMNLNLHVATGFYSPVALLFSGEAL